MWMYLKSLLMNSLSEYRQELKFLKNPLHSMKLFSELLEDGYDLRLQVTGASMSPFLETGSYVTIAPVPVTKLRAGDIIFYCCDDESFKLHRLIQVSGKKLLTKGDALCSFDPLVDKSGYKGKVVRIEHFQSGGVTFQNMDICSARLINFLIAKYQLVRSYLIIYIRLRSKSLKSLFSLA